MKRCFPSEINGCYYSLTFFSSRAPKALFSLAESAVSKVVEKRLQQTGYGVHSAQGEGLGERMERHVGSRAISWHERGLRTVHYVLP